MRHNHVTRDIKPLGACPGCDVSQLTPEEMYGMIWWLATHRARMLYATTDLSREQIIDVIDSARANHEDGLRRGGSDDR